MENNFIFFSPTKRSDTMLVSFASYGVNFNSGAIAALGKPKYVEFGYDAKNKLVAIKPAETNSENTIKFGSKERKGCVRLACKKGIETLEKALSVSLKEGTTRYVSFWDEKLKMLIVDFKKPLNHRGM